MEILDQPITTTQLANASDGNRILAYLIDALIAGALFFIPFVGRFAAIAYMLTRDGLPFLDGQSIGKKAMNIRAVTEDGLPLTNNWGPAIIRNILLLIPFLGALIELIVMLTNDKKQRLGDQWAKTRVVSVR
ncbi:MAG: RDD family protein [Saprospiraceae bacterium]|nr:RDD family protein [Saprospiraceae bacterium]